MNHFSIVSINSDKQYLLSEDPSVPRTTAASTSKHQSVKTLKKNKLKRRFDCFILIRMNHQQ